MTFAEQCGYRPTSRRRRATSALAYALLMNAAMIAFLPLTLPLRQALVAVTLGA